ncbi:HisA/HisF-related TIM barrel protein [Amylibacter sp.]|nr:HisA/HisF-related TIM barrel protein [Amylibacter sp.]
MGDCKWLLEKFRFSNIGNYIDELIILDVSRNTRNLDTQKYFCDTIGKLMKKIFVPLTIGGGIRTISDAHNYFQVGADKVSMNWAISKPELISQVVEIYGSQAVTVSLDVKLDNEEYAAYINYGQDRIGHINDMINVSVVAGVGEILITSIDQDGTGAGLDAKLLKALPDISIPIIACGGAGKPEHFFEILSLPNISGVATGNLFNFIGTGFLELRSNLCEVLPNLRRL